MPGHYIVLQRLHLYHHASLMRMVCNATDSEVVLPQVEVMSPNNDLAERNTTGVETPSDTVQVIGSQPAV